MQVKDKITDKWDYFDVKAQVPKNAAETGRGRLRHAYEQTGCHMPPA